MTGRRHWIVVLAAALLGVVSALSAADAHAGAALHFAPAVQTEPAGAAGTEPSAAVTADGVRMVTWQGGDPVDRSDDGVTWAQSTGGHDSSKCADTQGTHELFDGGDVHAAVDADGTTVYVSSLSFNETDGIGVDIETGTRAPNGAYSWAITSCHAGEPASDRPWIAAGPHHGDLVLYEKDLHIEAPVVRVSHDGGVTFGPISPVLTDPQYANFAVQVFNGNFAIAHDGTIYVPFLVPDPRDEPLGAGSSQSFPVTDVMVGVGHEDPTTHAVTFVDHRVAPPLTSLPSTANVAYIFASLALDSADHPVIAWSQAPVESGPYDVYMSSCAVSCSDPVVEADPLTTIWSPAVKVSGSGGDPAAGGSHVFPMVVAGSPGHVALAWYATPFTGDPTGGAAAGTLGSSPPPGGEPWRTYVASAVDWTPGSATPPTFTIADASGHAVHDGAVCIGGTFCDLAGAPTCPPVGCGNRGLADNLGLAVDPAGGVLVTWTDQSGVDANNNHVTRILAACQDAGPSLRAGRPDLSGCAASSLATAGLVPEGPVPVLAAIGVLVSGRLLAAGRHRRRRH